MTTIFTSFILLFILQGLGLFVFYTFFQTLRAERAERLARLSAIQRQMSQGHVQGLPTAEVPLVRGQSAGSTLASPSLPVPSSPPANA